MKYQVRVTRRAEKDIKKLDQVTKKRLKKKLSLFSQSPLRYAKKLFNSQLGSYRYRVGNYRIIFDVEGKNIIILRIGHRKEIYR